MEFRHRPISAARWIVNCSIVLIPLGLLTAWRPTMLPELIVVALFLVTGIFFANRMVQQTRLVLESDGLRYLKPGFETSLRWDEVTALRPVHGWGVPVLELHKRDGSYLLLANFQEMDEITRYVEMHVTPQKTPAVQRAAFLRSYSRKVVWGLLIVGIVLIWIGQILHGYGELAGIGGVLLILGVLGLKGAMPLNMRRRS